MKIASDWKRFLVAQGAVYTDDSATPDSFGDWHKEYLATKNQAGLFDCSNRSKVEMTGPDVPSFLNNLCTNQVNDLPLGGGCEAFLTNAKARLVAPLRVYHIQLFDGRHAYWLDSEPGLEGKILQHLDHFLISEQVGFVGRTEEFAQLHLAGPKANEILEKCIGEKLPPLEEHQHLVRNLGDAGACQIRRESPLGVPGFEIMMLTGRLESAWKNLAGSGAVPAGNLAYEAMRIEAGTLKMGRDMDENTFIPELNRAAQAISSTKGCYLGQEPIVMARDRGQVNRLLFGLVMDGDPVAAGTLLFKEGQEVGRVTSSVYSPGFKKTIGLGFLRRPNHQAGLELQIGEACSDCNATSVSLPFAVPS